VSGHFDFEPTSTSINFTPVNQNLSFQNPVQMKVNATPKRFLSVRLTSEELEEVYQYSNNSTCRSLTEYVKKVLTKKPVTVKVRNQSQDDLLAAMIGIKNRLDQLTDQAQDKNESEKLRELAEIRLMTRQIFEQWNRD
jgi:hypothetical protein